MINKKDAINEIIEYFNWDKVHKTMVALNWTWLDSEGKAPSVGALFKCATDLLDRVYDMAIIHKHDCAIANGGFRAQAIVDDDTKEIYELRLVFELCSWEYYVELDKESI